MGRFGKINYSNISRLNECGSGWWRDICPNTRSWEGLVAIKAGIDGKELECVVAPNPNNETR